MLAAKCCIHVGMWSVPRFSLALCVQVHSGPCCQLDDRFKRHYYWERSVDVFIAIFVSLVSCRAVRVALLFILSHFGIQCNC